MTVPALGPGVRPCRNCPNGTVAPPPRHYLGRAGRPGRLNTRRTGAANVRRTDRLVGPEPICRRHHPEACLPSYRITNKTPLTQRPYGHPYRHELCSHCRQERNGWTLLEGLFLCSNLLILLCTALTRTMPTLQAHPQLLMTFDSADRA